ncbi:MAG: hypothetical protein P0Y53_24985 [Candidatus Pseudobacter hemicellulosilyticus]|uniref:Uncharacterized protein n=1 Tax=Candidatus Pseudobacter hemicellulosilyticus TaxID=3121375 RepID=A0AAJ5WR25_9BACT|nr:MAG: hypothetical protein P0Y53_24985 [Pseudobacter sp.]
MKTSHKFLTAIILAAILIPTAVAAMVIIKYRNGQLQSGDPFSFFDNYPLGTVRYVFVDGLGNLELSGLDSTTRMIVDKEERDSTFHFRQSGDSLFLWVDTLRFEDGVEWYYDRFQSRSLRHVQLFLSPGTSISLKNCNSWLEGSKDSLQASSFDIQLRLAALTLGVNRNGMPSTKPYLGRVNIQAKNSNFRGDDLFTFRKLNLVLDQSEVSYLRNHADTLEVDTDADSNIEWKGDQLKKAKVSFH